MELRDVSAVSMAMMKWFQSQGIEPGEAAFCCIRFAGVTCGGMANDEEHLERGLKILHDLMEEYARASYKRGRGQ